jgi:hypothetical protein
MRTHPQPDLTTAAGWDRLRARLLVVAERHLREAGRCLEMVPGDPDIERLAAWSFRLASRCRAERVAA